MQATAAFLAAVSISAMLASDVAAATPLETVQQRVASVLTILRDRNPALDVETRAARVHAAAADLFDFTDMARRALGVNWLCCSASEQRELVPMVRDVLERSWVRTIENYADDSIVYTGQRIDGPYATVKSKIVTRGGLDLSVDYRLYALADRKAWKVFDVALEGCSVVSNYRAQFERIIHKESVAGLLERLHQKEVELMALRPRLGGDRARGAAVLLAPFLSRRRH